MKKKVQMCVHLVQDGNSFYLMGLGDSINIIPNLYNRYSSEKKSKILTDI